MISKYNINIYLFLLLITFVSLNAQAGSTSVDELNEEISNEYPTRRLTSAGYSILFGGFSFFSGSKVIKRSNRFSHKITGVLLASLGLIRVIDGGSQLFQEEPGEKLSPYVRKVGT